MCTSGHNGVPRLRFIPPLEITKSTEQNIWNNGLQSTGYQIANDSESWDIQNKSDELSDCPAYCLKRYDRLQCMEGKTK